MAKTITFSKVKRYIGFAGVTEEQQFSINDFRRMAATLRDVINTVFSPRSHKGKPVKDYIKTSKKGAKDEYGTFEVWRFPVFNRNKDEIFIYCKVWTGEVHGGSAIMWCAPAYSFTDAASSVQFEAQLNFAVDQSLSMAKYWTNRIK